METINELKALKEEYKNIFAELNAKLDNKIAELERVEQQTSRRWKPEKINERYYRINPIGEVDCISFQNDTIDKRYYDFHNMFKTKEEAEFAAERWRVMRELEILSDDDKEWNGMNAHCAIQYTSHKESIHCVNLYHDRANPLHFKTKESAEKAVDNIGEDRLKKYWFGIKED